MPQHHFRVKLLQVGDVLYQAGLYQLARIHGYRRYLTEVGLPQQALEDLVLKCENEASILGMVSPVHSLPIASLCVCVFQQLRSEIGDTACHYSLTEGKDPLLLVSLMSAGAA